MEKPETTEQSQKVRAGFPTGRAVSQAQTTNGRHESQRPRTKNQETKNQGSILYWFMCHP